MGARFNYRIRVDRKHFFIYLINFFPLAKRKFGATLINMGMKRKD